MIRPFLLLVLLVMGLPAVGQTLLYPGDIALVNVNADGDKSFDVLFLRDITTSTVVYFTDDAWIDSSQQFRGSEGFLAYTAARDLPAGSVVSCPGKDGGNGFAKLSGSFNPSGSGDNIIVFQGSREDPFFLYGVGWARGSTVWEYAESSASYRSDIPPGLSVSEGTIASLGTDDNYRYKTSSTTTGTLSDLLTSIADPVNWDSDNANPFTAFTQLFSITSSDFNYVSTTDPAEVPPRSLVVITTAVSLSGSLTCQSLSIASGGSIEILPGATLKVYGMITNEAVTDGLVIRSDSTGSGALNHSVAGVQGTVHRFIGPGQWHFVSSPVPYPGLVDDLFGTAGDGLHGIFYYDETGGAWVSAAGTAMDPGRGYNVCYTGEGRTVIFRGTLNDCRLRSWIQVTRGSGSGWNLVGNPFPCSLSWGAADQADAPGWKNQATTLDNKTIWITTGGSGEGTTFVTFNGSSGVGVPDNSTGIIAPGQAFWVRAAADGEIGVGGYAKSGEHGTYKTGRRADYKTGRQGGIVYRFNLTSLANGLSDQVAVVIDDRAERGLDRFDSEKKIGTGPTPQFFIPVQNIPLVINALPASDFVAEQSTDTLLLTIMLPAEGDYQISQNSWSGFSSEHPSTSPLFHFFNSDIGVSFSFILEDRLTGARQALSERQSYAFSAGAGILEERFRLLVTSNEEVEMWRSEEVFDRMGWTVTVKPDCIVLSFKTLTDPSTVIRLIDLGGKTVSQKPVRSSLVHTLMRPQKQGVFIVQVRYPAGNSSRKIFVN